MSSSARWSSSATSTDLSRAPVTFQIRDVVVDDVGLSGLRSWGAAQVVSHSTPTSRPGVQVPASQARKHPRTIRPDDDHGPIAQDAVSVRFPYRAKLRGATWNAQALFSVDGERQSAKQAILCKLASQHDFVILQETHSTEGALAIWRPPSGFRYFHSHGSQAVAGIGVLVRSSFLANFDPIPEHQLHELVPGRAGVLHLTGPTGCLDIFAFMQQRETLAQNAIIYGSVSRGTSNRVQKCAL